MAAHVNRSLMRALVAWVLLLASHSAAAAGAELVLRDGQVLRGSNVERKGDVYVLDVEPEGVLTIPVALVQEVRLRGDEGAEEAVRPAPSGLRRARPEVLAGQRRPEGPSGLREGKSQTLAGRPVRPPKTSEQLRALGKRSTFPEGAVDPRWEPVSAFDARRDVLARGRSSWQRSTIEPEWRPETAFDADADVLAPGKSVWQESILDPEWYPTDGFERQRAAPRASASASGPAPPRGARYARGYWASVAGACTWCLPPAPVASRISAPPASAGPRECAERILRQPSAGSGPGETDGRTGSISPSPVEDPRYSALPVRLYQATAGDGADRRRAVFTLADGSCRLLGGDLRELLDVEISDDMAAAHAASAYNSVLGGTAAVRPAGAREKIDYAYAVVSLADPNVSGRRSADTLVLAEVETLKSLGAGDPRGCTAKARKRRKALRQAVRRYDAPQVRRGARGELITFQTWSSHGGRIVRNAVFLHENGTLSVARETIAAHIGAHEEP